MNEPYDTAYACREQMDVKALPVIRLKGRKDEIEVAGCIVPMWTASNKVDAAKIAAGSEVGCNIPVGWVRTETPSQ
jgi:hypothetical protein